MAERSTEERRRSFDANAELYDAARPAYPHPLVDDLLARTQPTPGNRCPR